MSAFKSASSLKPAAYDCSAPRPRPAKFNHCDSEATQVLLAGILNDLKARNEAAAKLKSLLAYFATFFDMSALELAAWCFILRSHFPACDSLPVHITALRLTAFHAKAILGCQMDTYCAKIENEDSTFAQVYEETKASMPFQLSMQEVHNTYRELMRRIHAHRIVRNTNKEVIDILQVKEVELRVGKPRKVRKREEVCIDIASTPFLPVIPCACDFAEMDSHQEVDDLLFDVGVYLS